MSAGNAREVRQNNRAAVLRSLVMSSPTSRAQLAAECGLSLASVTNLVSELIADGLVVEQGSLPSGGGRPIGMLSPRPDGAAFIGVDVGEHGVTVELFDLAMHPLERVFRAVRARSVTPQRLATTLRRAVDEVRSAGEDQRIAGIGLGLPGIVATSAGDESVLYAQTLGWKPVAVDRLLPDSDLPVFADNGAKTLATAELWHGAARGVGHGIVALLGRGVGAGLISNGRVLRGASSSAGEWGHTKVSLGGPHCACGARGCLEAYVGAEALARRWSDTSAAAVDDDPERVVPALLAAAEGGDEIARKVVDETVEMVGIGLANVVNLLNPECVVVGGWAGLQLMEVASDRIATAVIDNTLDRPAAQCRVVPSQIGVDAVALGAALLPLEAFIDGDVELPGGSR